MAPVATVELHPDRLSPAEPGTRRLGPGAATADAAAKGGVGLALAGLDLTLSAVLNVLAPGLGNDQGFVDAALRQARAVHLTSLPERAVDNPGSRNGDSSWQS